MSFQALNSTIHIQTLPIGLEDNLLPSSAQEIFQF